MARKDQKLDPQHPQGLDNVWFYEARGGLEFVVEASQIQRPVQFTLSWRTIRAALKRKDKP